MWTRSTSANGTARTSPHGGFAAWFSFSSSLVVNGSVHKSSRVRTASGVTPARSEEHTSELQSPCNLVCRLLLEKKKKRQQSNLLTLHDEIESDVSRHTES